MKTPATKPASGNKAPSAKQTGNAIQNKNASTSQSLPAVPVFQLLKETDAAATSKDKTTGKEKQSLTSKSGTRTGMEEQKTRMTATAALENLLYQRKAVNDDKPPFKPIQKKENKTGLPVHEAWHVVQQKQSRVKPTIKNEGNGK